MCNVLLCIYLFVLEKMNAKNPFNIRIPSVFVGYDAGLNIKKNYQWTTDYFIIITAEDPLSINQLLIPFAVVVGICFIIMLIFLVSSYFVKSFLMNIFLMNKSF